MISSRQDYLYYLEADRIALSIPVRYSWPERVRRILQPDYLWLFQKNLRKLEYYKNCKQGVFSRIPRFMLSRKHSRLSLKLGFSIPVNTFGPGLAIAHYGTIIVNERARIGANCRLHACVNIGTEAGYSHLVPTIGDNCYIGPGAKIFGNIVIPNCTAIGANAVVNRSFDQENTAIAGVPAAKIADIDIFDLLIPATIVIEKGLNKLEFSGLSARELKSLMKADVSA